MRNFIFFVSDLMSEYTLQDIKNMDNVHIVNKTGPFNSRVLNLLFKLNNSVKINNIIRMPLRKLWYKKIMYLACGNETIDYFVLTPPWYDKTLIKYIRHKYPSCKIILHCKDTIKLATTNNTRLNINVMRSEFDGVIVYNELDARKYGFNYHFVGYSELNEEFIVSCNKCDVAFIGAAKDRLEDIRYVFDLLKNSGLNCYFYVTGVPEKDRRNDGIIYADRNMDFVDYISHEKAASCLFEILQKNSLGRTYRLMEAIIYNKRLITNCPEILDMEYYSPDNVLYYEDVKQIDPIFVKKSGVINYQYQGDFSPKRFLEYIEETWSNEKKGKIC